MPDGTNHRAGYAGVLAACRREEMLERSPRPDDHMPIVVAVSVAGMLWLAEGYDPRSD